MSTPHASHRTSGSAAESITRKGSFAWLVTPLVSSSNQRSDATHDGLLRTSVWLIAIAVILAYSSYVFLSRELVVELTREDGFFENATAAFFLVASIMFLASWVKQRNVFFALLAFAFFFACGEEIAWGQRLVGFDTPASVAVMNVQGDFTFHNLELFAGRNMDKSARQGVERLLTISLLFQVFCLAYGVLLPVVNRMVSPLASLLGKLKMPVPPLAIGIFFFVCWVTQRALLSSDIPPIPDALNEIREAISALIFMALSFWFFARGCQQYRTGLTSSDFVDSLLGTRAVRVPARGNQYPAQSSQRIVVTPREV